MTYLIEKEDAVRLQRIMDLSTEVHGEINSLYDLVFAFLDCGRSRQAKKILEVRSSRLPPSEGLVLLTSATISKSFYSRQTKEAHRHFPLQKSN